MCVCMYGSVTNLSRSRGIGHVFDVDVVQGGVLSRGRQYSFQESVTDLHYRARTCARKSDADRMYEGKERAVSTTQLDE